MTLSIEALDIQQFRAIRELSIRGLGRVNLITGRNNSGKSSVLEALRILATDASSSTIFDILRSREENIVDSEDTTQPLDADGWFLLSSLFHGFPQFSPELAPISIASNGGQRRLKLMLKAAWVSEQRGEDGVRRVIPQQQVLFEAAADVLPALVVDTNGSHRIVPLESWRRYGYRGRTLSADRTSEPRLPCVFVSPYGGEQTAMLGVMWDRIALSDREQDVVDALKIIAPEISAVSMVGGEGPRQLRTAIVRASGVGRPVPLRSFGDGLNRLFGIVLSLVNAKDGLLLIDEFENGMHYSVQADVWRVLFRLATRLNIQIVATSHSWDAIEAFQQAANGTREDGVLVRLTRKGEDIIPTIFCEDELAVATRDRIEVR